MSRDKIIIHDESYLWCNGCEQYKHVTCFAHKIDGPHGYNSRCKKCRKEYNDRHKEQIKVYQTQYDIDSKDSKKEYYYVRFEQKRFDYMQTSAYNKAVKLGVKVEFVNYREIFERDGLTCYLCEQYIDPNDISFDHVIPFSKGGNHTKSNIKICHLSCNKLKGSDILWEG